MTLKQLQIILLQQSRKFYYFFLRNFTDNFSEFYISKIKKYQNNNKLNFDSTKIQLMKIITGHLRNQKHKKTSKYI